MNLRKKKTSESYLEYLYEILALGAQDNIDIPAIITHTINGLPGPIHTKAFLYDSSTLKDFKKKLCAFELNQNQNQSSFRKNDENFEKKPTENSRIVRCRNCGSKFHQTDSCFQKDKGP